MMRRTALYTVSPVALLAAALFVAVGADSAPARAAEPTLKRVVLSTGGVGVFEYEATVKGDEPLTLEAPRDRMDDVLKSLIVYDDGGAVGSVALPGPEPLEAAFRETPFTVDDLSSPAALLTALRGATVEVGGPHAATGRVLSATPETRIRPGYGTDGGGTDGNGTNGGGVEIRHRLTLSTDAGLRQVILEEADALRFTDPGVQAQIDAALSALAANGKRDRRRLTIRPAATDPTAERRVRLAYVAAAPLWKIAYRLNLSPDESPTGGKAALQGWAVLENVSGRDWRDVELILTSGAPTALRQALYNAYYVDRPEAPIDVNGRILPPLDDGAIPQAAFRDAAPPPPPVPAPAAAPAPKASAGFAREFSAQSAVPARPETGAATAIGETAQVLFRAPHPVSVVNGGTLTLPIVAADFPVERTALHQPDAYRQGGDGRRPLAALRLTNDGRIALPPGVVTIYDSAVVDKNGGVPVFVGDARLGVLPAGENRLLSYAVDQTVVVDRRTQPGRTVAEIVVADGVATLTVQERQTTLYSVALSAGAETPRKIIVEHPRHPHWEPVAPPADLEAAADVWRFSATVEPGKTTTASLTVQRPKKERIVLADPEAVGALTVFADAGELPAETRAKLKELAGLRADLTEKERRVAEIDRERGELAAEQERLRANLKAAPGGGDLHRRILAKLGDSETRLDALAGESANARKASEAARRTLTDRLWNWKA